MKLSETFILPVCLAIFTLTACAGPKPAERQAAILGKEPIAAKAVKKDSDPILTGAEQTEKYLKLLKG